MDYNDPNPSAQTPGPDHRADVAPAIDPSGVSPKITAGALAALALIVLQAILTAITPEMFDFAGEFSHLVFTAVTALGFGVAAWLKGDPARTGYTERQVTGR
jgi:hypothetical protein